MHGFYKEKFMLITLHTRQLRINARQRHLIEAYVRRLFRRQQPQLARCDVNIAPIMERGNLRRVCRVQLWSPSLGYIVVRDVADTTRSAVQQAALRARAAVRRRLHKRLARARRVGDSRRGRGSPAAAFN
jgi:hypothetical protein